MKTNFPGMLISVDDLGGLDMIVDLKKELGDTSTGKSRIIANTSGWKQISTPEGVYKINCLIIKMK